MRVVPNNTAVPVAPLPGPGGDVVLSISSGYLVQTLLLVVLGVGPCAALGWTGRLPEPD